MLPGRGTAGGEGVEEAGIWEGAWVWEGRSSLEVSGVLEVGSAWPWQAWSFWSIVGDHVARSDGWEDARVLEEGIAWEGEEDQT